MAIKRRSVLMGSAALWVGAPAILRAQTSPQDKGKIHVGHGFAMHGEPKYKADAGPPDYLNPNAPAGGSVRLGARGTFDSLHPFIVKSVPAAGITAIWDTLCWNSRDEASTEYGLIAETIGLAVTTMVVTAAIAIGLSLALAVPFPASPGDPR